MLPKKLLLLAALALATIACQKEQPLLLSLPPITETGQNTIGFLLDDQVWTTYGGRCTIVGCRDNEVEAHLSRQPNGDFELEVSAAYSLAADTTDQLFFFYATNVTTTGTFPMDSSLHRGMTFIANAYAQWYRDYKSNPLRPATLTISRLDTTNFIIAGTFSGVLFNPADQRDSVVIREGRFDAILDYRR